LTYENQILLQRSSFRSSFFLQEKTAPKRRTLK